MSYDWMLDESGDLSETGLTIGGDMLVLQALKIQLGTARGEWPLDSDAGVPWLEWSEFAPAPVGAVEAWLLAEILSVEGVAAVERSDVRLDVAAARIEGEFTIRLESQARARLNLAVDPLTLSNNPALVVGITPFGALSSR